MEQFSKDKRFNTLIDSLTSYARSENKKGTFILHRLVETTSFGALKTFKFNLFYFNIGLTKQVASWEFKTKITEETYNSEMEDIFTKLIAEVIKFTHSEEFKNL